MAKKKAPKKKTPKQFLTEIASDPKKLANFIVNPEAAMNAAKIEPKHRPHIKQAIAHEVYKRLTIPEAYAVFLC